MASTRQHRPADADAGAPALREAGFVRIRARPDGDSLAAAGLLARALDADGTPFRARVAREPAPGGEDADRAGAGDDLLVTVGTVGGDLAFDGADCPASVGAYTVAEALGAPDPTTALAGAVSAGVTPESAADGDLLAAAREGGRIERRPGVGIPTDDLIDGLAHSTLVHAPASGAPDAVEEALGGMELSTDPAAWTDPGPEARRAVASWLAITVATGDDAPSRAAAAVERALRPHATPEGPLATVEGYADVLDAVAREAPGAGIALALGDDHDAVEAALGAWRDHARAVHRGLRDAATGRYAGVFVARPEDAPGATSVGRLDTAARLLREFGSPEPVALVVAPGAAAAASVEARDLGETMESAAANLDGAGHGGDRRGVATFDAEAPEFVTAFREVL